MIGKYPSHLKSGLTLILDLDETLVHSDYRKLKKNELFVDQVTLQYEDSAK